MNDGQATVPSKKRNTRSETQTGRHLIQAKAMSSISNVARKPSHLDGGAGRWVRREIAAIDFVHGREVGKVLEEYRRFHHAVERRPGRLDDALQIFHHAPGLPGHVAFHQFLGARIQRDLPRDENESVGLDGLRIGANSFRPAVGGDHFSHGHLSWSRNSKSENETRKNHPKDTGSTATWRR